MVSGMFVGFRCVIANFGPQRIRVSRNAQRDLDGRNSLVCAKKRSPKDHVVRK